jgi:hypothetical protein
MSNPMKTHVAIIAWINILFGVPGALIGAFVALGLVGAGIMAPVLLPFVVPIGLILFFYAVIGVVAGIGLLQGAPWSRIVMIILTIFHIINVGTVGISTIFGIYSLFILFHKETERLFDRGF